MDKTCVKFTNGGLSFSLFYCSFSFSFCFIFSFFYFQNIELGLDHKTQRMKQKDLEQIISYNMDITCQPHVLHIVVQGRLYSSEYGPLVVVYYPTLRTLVHNNMDFRARLNQYQYQLSITYINRTAIQQRLLVKFYCNPHINSLLRVLLPCVIIELDVQWLLQQDTSFS